MMIDHKALKVVATLIRKANVPVMLVCLNAEEAQLHADAFMEQENLTTRQNKNAVWFLGRCIQFASAQMAANHGFGYGGIIVVCEHVRDGEVPGTNATDWRQLAADRAARLRAGTLKDFVPDIGKRVV